MASPGGIFVKKNRPFGSVRTVSTTPSLMSRTAAFGTPRPLVSTTWPMIAAVVGNADGTIGRGPKPLVGPTGCVAGGTGGTTTGGGGGCACWPDSPTTPSSTVPSRTTNRLRMRGRTMIREKSPQARDAGAALSDETGELGN